MYLWFKKLAFEVKYCGKYIFEYSREHRQQRWYVTVMDKKTKVMMAKTIMDEDMEEFNMCMFDAFLLEAVPALDKFIMEMNDGEAEAVQSEEEGTAESAGNEEDESVGRED